MDATTLPQGGTRLILCLLLGITAVLASKGLKPNQDFQYQFNSTIVVRAKHNDEGVFAAGMVNIHTYTSSVLYMEIPDLTFWRIGEELPEGLRAEPSSSSQEKFWKLLQTSISCFAKMKNGLLEKLYFEPHTPDWQINIALGILSQFQYSAKAMHKKQRNAIHGNEFSYTDGLQRFKENTTFGRCEVSYSVHPATDTVGKSSAYWNLPRKYNECNYVDKIINFDNCEDAVESHFGLPETTHCNPTGNFCGDFWNRASHLRVYACGGQDERIVQKTEWKSTVTAKLLQTIEATINSHTYMNLVSVKPLKERSSLPSQRNALSHIGYKYTARDFNSVNNAEASSQDCVDENGDASATNDGNQTTKCGQTSADSLIFTAFGFLPEFNWEYPPQQPLLPISLYTTRTAADTLAQDFKKSIEDMASYLEDAQNLSETVLLDKFMYARQLCSIMSHESLKKSIGSVMDKTIKNDNRLLTIRKLYRDVIGKCGTSPSLLIIRQWIKEKLITASSIADFIASLPEHIQDPSPGMVKLLYNLTQLPPIKHNTQLFMTANLALSNFIRIACVDQKARAVRFSRAVQLPNCTEEDIEPYVEYFAKQLEDHPRLRGAFIHTLGNTGSKLGMEKLKSVVTDSDYSSYLKATAVLAVKYNAFVYREETADVLFSWFQNYSQPIPVRVAAASMLFFVHPSYDIWLHLAYSTWDDPSTSVAQFVRTSLVSLSTFKDPVYKSAVQNAKRVVPYSKPINSKLFLSFNLFYAEIIEELENIWSYQATITNEIDAGSLYFRITRRMAELTRIPFDGEIWLSNKDDFLTMIQDWVYPHGDPVDVRPPIENLERTITYVTDILNITTRVMPPVEGKIHGIFDKLTERVAVFDEEYVQKWLDSFVPQTNPVEFHYQNADYRGFKLCAVTELGFPLCFMHHEPWFVQFIASLKALQDPSSVHTSISIKHIEKHIGTLSFYTAWDGNEYSAEFNTLVSAQVPEINLKTKYVAETQKLKFELQTKVAENEPLLLHHSKQAFTSYRNVGDSTPVTQTRTWRPIHSDPSSQVSKSFKLGKHFEVHVSYSTPHPYSHTSHFAHNHDSLYYLWEMLSLQKYGDVQIKLSELPNLQFDIEIGNAKIEHGKISMGYDTSMSSSEEVSSETENARKKRTIPSGSARPAATHTNYLPTAATQSVKELFSNLISETAYEVEEEVTDNQAAFSLFDPSDVNLTATHDRFTYILRQSLSGISNGQSQMINCNMTIINSQTQQIEDKYSVYMAHAESTSAGRHNYGVFLKKETAHKDWEIGWTSNFLTPEGSYFNLKDIQTKSFESIWFSFLHYRLQNEKYNTGLQVRMNRSHQRMQAINKQLKQRQCSDFIDPECRALEYEAMLATSYNVSLIYSTEEPYLAPWIEKLPDLLRYYLQHHSSEPQWKSRKTSSSYYDVINMKFDVAEDLSFLNVQADTKTTSMAYENIPVQTELMEALLYNPGHGLMLVTSSTTCEVSLSKVTTFDEVHYGYKMKPQWHVITKDATNKTLAMMLMRPGEDNTMDIEINMDDYIVASISSGKVTVRQGEKTKTLDGYKEYRDLNNTLILRVNYLTNRDSNVILQYPEHGLEIIYSPTALVVLAQEKTRGRLVGLCGDNNGEKIGEFQTPTEEIVKSPQEFVDSYALPDDIQPTSKAPKSSAEQFYF